MIDVFVVPSTVAVRGWLAVGDPPAVSCQAVHVPGKSPGNCSAVGSGLLLVPGSSLGGDIMYETSQSRSCCLPGVVPEVKDPTMDQNFSCVIGDGNEDFPATPTHSILSQVIGYFVSFDVRVTRDVVDENIVGSLQDIEVVSCSGNKVLVFVDRPLSLDSVDGIFGV